MLKVGGMSFVELAHLVPGRLEGGENDGRGLVCKRHGSSHPARERHQTYEVMLRKPRPNTPEDPRIVVHPRSPEGVAGHDVLPLLQANAHEACSAFQVRVFVFPLPSVCKDCLRKSARYKCRVCVWCFPPLRDGTLVGSAALVSVHLLMDRHMLDDGGKAKSNLSTHFRRPSRSLFVEGVRVPGNDGVPPISENPMRVQAIQISLVSWGEMLCGVHDFMPARGPVSQDSMNGSLPPLLAMHDDIRPNRQKGLQRPEGQQRRQGEAKAEQSPGMEEPVHPGSD
mmetsp:Transcript_80656/g.145605  ORF Transcript_80656/g.145605 Transcript_80656/m.145605 type:complete len:282 (-) Transcript_80656:180-1025(-)